MSTSNKIIGIGGSNGAGKDTIGEILVKEFGFIFVNVSDALREEARNRGLSVERKHLRLISAEWRAKYGLGVLVDKAYDKFQKSGSAKGLATGAIRNGGEADRIHELGGTLIWVDADPKLRYHRIQEADRGRASEDNITFEEFMQHEADEMTSKGDETTLAGADVKAKADITIINEGEMSDLVEQIKQKLHL